MKKFLRFGGVLFWTVLIVNSAAGAAAMSKGTAAKFDRLIEEAGALEKRNDFKGAEAKMTAAIALAPEEPSAYYNRARFRSQAGLLEGAEEDINTYLRLNAGDLDGFELRALIRFKRNNLAGALEDANAALRTGDTREGARLVRAHALRAHGRYKEALKDYERLAGTRVDGDEVRAARAECELSLGDYSSAKLKLKALATHHPENGWAHYMLGRAQFGLQEFEAAIASHRRARELKMDEVEMLKWIGYSQFAQGKDAEAIATFKEAIAARPAVSPFAYLVMHAAIRRAGRSVSESPLRDVIDGWDSGWTQALGRYLLGTLSDRELVKQAKATKDQEERDGKLCEAYYYIGATRLVEMDIVAGEVFFERVLGTRSSTFVEYTLARAELRRL